MISYIHYISHRKYIPTFKNIMHSNGTLQYTQKHVELCLFLGDLIISTCEL